MFQKKIKNTAEMQIVTDIRHPWNSRKYDRNL